MSAIDPKLEFSDFNTLPESFELASPEAMQRLSDQAEALRDQAGPLAGQTINGIRVEADATVASFTVGTPMQWSRFTVYRRLPDDDFMTFAHEDCKPVPMGELREVEYTKAVMPLSAGGERTLRHDKGFMSDDGQFESSFEGRTDVPLTGMTLNIYNDVTAHLETVSQTLSEPPKRRRRWLGRVAGNTIHR